MTKKKVKSFTFMGGLPTDIYNGFADIFLTLEDDDFEYWVEVTTPQALSSHMEKNQVTFLEPNYPCIIVRELTPAVIREALEAFAFEKEDAFWLKLYHLTVEWNIHDLNTILDRHKKKLEYEEKKDMLEKKESKLLYDLKELQKNIENLEQLNNADKSKILTDFKKLSDVLMED